MSAKPQETDVLEAESIEFSAEISKVLKLMIHSLYTNKDIFLRELISNASDACDKLRYEAVKNDALLAEDSELKIHIDFDDQQQTVSISDNGIGMNREDLIDKLGTIAKSGTEEFLNALTGDKNKDVSLIGQFGVGFYSSFMVADKVEVTSCKAGEEEAWRWVSDGSGYFTIEPSEMRSRGTTITLFMKEEAKEYLDFFRLQHIAQTYSDHISFPITITNAENEPQEVNTGAAIWTRSKSDISEEQYTEFYRHVAHSPDEPWMTLHNKAEGKIEYTNLLYVPSMKPFDLFHPERRRRVKLYVKRVFITDEGVDIVPQYLRFLRGVVDSQDLPLNISRETLQDNPLIAKIREAITSKVLGELIKKSEKKPEEYEAFWNNFGPVLKEGLCESIAAKDKLLQACLFRSSNDDGLVSLKTYMERMQPEQEAIYYLIGDDVQTLKNSPQLEGFRKQGIEVLLLTDQVDDFWVNATPSYEGKDFRSVVRSGKDLEKFDADTKGEAKDETDESSKEDAVSVEGLIVALKDIYGDEIREVRTTKKLAESPVCLAVGEGDMDMRMERFLLEHKQLPKATAKILEINPDHAVIQHLSKQTSDGELTKVKDTAWLLLDMAKIQEGDAVKDPGGFTKRINALLAQAYNL